MMELYVGVAAMTVLALAFVLWPWYRNVQVSSMALSDYTVALHKQQQAVLLAQYQAQVLSHEEYEEASAGLAAALLADLPEQEKPLRVTSPPVYVLPLLALFLIAFALLWYAHFGASEQVAQQLALQHSDAQALLMERDPQRIIARLRDRVQQHPDSAQGWFLLGKLYLSSGQWTLADDALAKAYRLRPAHTDTQLYYAQTLFFLSKGQLHTQAQRLLAEVLAQQPDNPLAIHLLAADAYQRGRYAQAIAYWERVLALYAPESEEGKALLQLIAKAQRAQQQHPAFHPNSQ